MSVAPRSESVRELLSEARQALDRAPFRPPGREASLLLGHVLGWSEVWILAHPEATVAPERAARFRGLLARRLAATPVAYLVGEREFWGRSFAVDERVLVPRPETEHLVEVVLDLALPPRPRILEIGTGSGCVAVTLALELLESTVVATDISPAALAVAAANAARHGVEGRVRLLAGDLTAGTRVESFDLVVSNPPYVARRDAAELSPEVVDHEPALALFGEGDGTGTVARLLRATSGAPLVALEIGAGQLPAVESLAAAHAFVVERVVPDLAGIPRTLLLVSGR